MVDAVVIGSGPNGLVAANLLADAGWSVAVLEAAAEPGGAVRTAELVHPGFRHDLFSAFYPLAAASPAMAGLRLEEHGLRWRRSPLVLAHPLPDGRCASLSMDVEATAAAVEAFAAGDGDAWRSMTAAWRQVGDAVVDAVLGPAPPLRAVARLAGRLGPVDTLRLARHLLLPVRRMAGEGFRGEAAGLLLGGCALHTDLAPEAAGSGLYGWLLCCLGQQHGFPLPEGGAGALSAALVSRLAARGGTVQCNAPVVRVVVRRGRAVAVRTAAGDTYDARRAVVADVAAPALYRDLVGRDHLPASVLDDLGHFDWDTATVKVDWALDGPIPWSCPDARRAGTVHVANDFDDLTESAAHVAMGRLPARPFVVAGQPSTADPSRAPEGAEAAWAYAHVPQRPRMDAAGVLPVDRPGSWVAGFADRIEARIEALAPGFRGLVRDRHVWSPGSLQAEDANLVGGAINGGTAQLHQQLLLRPIPGSGRPETPIVGLYLASASAHPGGGVHGAGGANAARAALLPASRVRAVLAGRAPLRPRR